MEWKDLFYFSQGERRALSLLLFLLILFLIFRLWNEYAVSNLPEKPPVSENIIESQKKDSTIQITKNPSSRPGQVSRQKKQPNKTNSVPNSYLGKTTKKYPSGTIVELNTADTTELKKIPGIGSVFANRIIKYRDLLGGFYTVTQLKEVYGIDEQKFQDLCTWFTTDGSLIQKLVINELSEEQLRKHPYINYKQAKIIRGFIHKKGAVSGWDDLKLLKEFPEPDRERLAPYFDFEK